MDLARLIDELSRQSAYLFPVSNVETRQTHISVVFLAGSRAFKIKKPVELGFLDFRTLDQRKHYCEEEVRLNRRLAAHVYLGVVPVTLGPDGCRFGGDGEPVEWAVEMVRLPEHATLEQFVERDETTPEMLISLAQRIADFHRTARSGPEVSDLGKFEVVAGNARENFIQSASQVGETVSQRVFERLRSATEHALELLRPLIDSRAVRGVPRDTHGDMHLDHVYLFPEEPPPRDITVIDCIEFNERFRYADPIADIAFLTMDFKNHGRYDLARVFAGAYYQFSADDEGRALLPFYTAYRSIIRAKVEGFKLVEPEMPEEAKKLALQKSRGHWLLALGEMAIVADRPMLLLLAGLPGAGKSTLAYYLADRHGFDVVRSDVIRKELAGAPVTSRTPAEFRAGMYDQEMTSKTYAECRRRAAQLLWDGKRVVIDASFSQDSFRREFLRFGDEWGVPVRLLHCTANRETIRHRLQQRRNDASDADWPIYLQAAEHWEPISAKIQRSTREFSTDASRDQVLAALSQWLESELALM